MKKDKESNVNPAYINAEELQRRIRNISIMAGKNGSSASEIVEYIKNTIEGMVKENE